MMSSSSSQEPQQQQQPAGAPAAEPPRLPYESISITVAEDRNCYTVKGQMVGVYREDIDIDISDDRTLRIRAVRRASGGNGMSMMMTDQQQHQAAGGGAGEDPVVCQIGRNYILPKFADPDNMRADLLGTELVIIIYKSSEHIDKKKARTS